MSAGGERPAFISTSTPVPPATSVADGSAVEEVVEGCGLEDEQRPAEER